MANFKIGDRVRIKDHPNILAQHRGAETTITGPSFSHPWIAGPCWPVACYAFGAAESVLVPLTDPKADEFIERVRKWKPEPEVVLTPEDRLMQRNEQYAP